MEEIGDLIVKKLQDALSSEGLSGSELYKSISYNISGDNKIQITMNDYGTIVDTGRKPGKKPPIDAISEWASQKGINPWALQSSIAKKGTTPHPFLYILDNIDDEIEEIIIEQQLKIQTENIDNIFKI